MDIHFRQANQNDAAAIWTILQHAILRRKNDGSTQWQDGYPNPEIINNDILKGAGYVLVQEDQILGYTAIYFNDEPAYENIQGKWLTNNNFVVVHRIAIGESQIGKGFAKLILKYVEQVALEENIYSIKADTNYDNLPMLRIFESLGYQYCGEVFFRGSPRKAFEKTLKP
ncbi:GNAT family N-acetyltransferase [Flavobacterium sp. CHNK8]|uniref:GNAT family N-acetyltransferase n=1 Tax=Flavobacterium sp. CHNK8 TaxID=2871165 RepID=UPI001C8D897D|nr:GNAT family N-acetyltransferase [Flavobacterium sp. CHNK8]QZK89983.1 GNAT family N-acetyltransferase [Flavobacterium sp. CHNK8]